MKSASSSSRRAFGGGGGAGGQGRYIETRLGARFTPGVIALLAVFGATYLLQLILPESLRNFIATYLVLQPNQALGLRPYQLIVAPTLMTSLISYLFLALLLWSIGSAIEDRVGTRRFLSWSASASFAAALTAAIVGRLFGLIWPQLLTQPVPFEAQPVFMATLVAFGSFYGRMPVTMWGIGQPVSGRGLSYFFIGIAFVADLWRQQWLQLAADVGAAGWTWLLLYAPWQGGLGRLRALFPAKKKRHGLGVIDGGLGPSGRPKADKDKQERWVN